MLSSFYLLALAGVAVGILATLIGAAVSVSRNPPWSVVRPRLADADNSGSSFLDPDRLLTHQPTPGESHAVEHKRREIEQVA